jgi:hypothetical protein
VSDIGILNDPVSLIVIALILGSPGFVLGAIPGAFVWRRRRVAVVGFVVWLVGWMLVKDVI